MINNPGSVHTKFYSRLTDTVYQLSVKNNRGRGGEGRGGEGRGGGLLTQFFQLKGGLTRE